MIIIYMEFFVLLLLKKKIFVGRFGNVDLLKF